MGCRTSLLLKKAPDDEYGEWYKMQFSRNIQPSETDFGLDLSTFFKRYEESAGDPFHKVKTDKLSDEDILSLLEKMMRGR